LTKIETIVEMMRQGHAVEFCPDRRSTVMGNKEVILEIASSGILAYCKICKETHLVSRQHILDIWADMDKTRRA